MRNAKPLTRKGRGDVGVAEQGETSVYTVQELRKRRKWISILVCISLAMVAGMAIVPIIMLRNSSEQASPELRPDGVGKLKLPKCSRHRSVPIPRHRPQTQIEV